MKPKLRFREAEISKFADHYSYNIKDQNLFARRSEVIKRGWMTKADLREIAKWKAPRAAGHIETNDEDYVKEVSKPAFSASNERMRIEVLTILDGVSWPTASVILHFFHRDPYPILDFRALWSVGLDVPMQYSFEFWWNYVEFCRTIAARNKMSIRTLDKALWQYSKCSQD